MSRIFRLKPACEPKNFRAELEKKLERATAGSKCFSILTSLCIVRSTDFSLPITR